MIEAASIASPRNPSGLRWALVPVFLLASSVLGVGSMAFVATHDPSFSTEPDYYQKAVRWDQTQAQAAENQRLGYQFTLPRTLPVTPGRRALVELVLRDRSGQMVSGAHVKAEAFSNLAASETTALAFNEREPGRYEAALVVTHVGVWDFRVAAERGAEHFTDELRTELVAEAAR